MTAAYAAGYCGEPSVEAFLGKVKAGIYPQPTRCGGSLPKWHRHKLDTSIARRHGIQHDCPEVEDATALI
jgi:hypothetical protein